MNQDWEIPTEEQDGPDGPGARHLQQRLQTVLETRPEISVPAGFAARVAAAARNEASHADRRVAWRWPLGWGLTASLCSLVFLLSLMLRYAQDPQGSGPLVAELALGVEFVVLLLGMMYFSPGLE